jgi:hypothetical protein
MEIRCYPRLSKEQEKNLPNDYVRPLIEGMYEIDDEHPDGIIFIYVGYCDWEDRFDRCLKEFILTLFHETMHVMFPDLENCVPYAEKILAKILGDNDE